MISIIVPVYNVEEYLSDCINSLLNQTYKNFEMLLIDDGSTDESGKICDEYAKIDGRIAAFHKQNGGLSDARNYGLDRAKGEYVLFIDSDDLLNKRGLELLLSKLINNNVSACFSPLIQFPDGKKPNINYDLSSNYEIISNVECMKRMLLSIGIGHEAPAKLYRREVWEHRRFPIGKLYEDMLTTYDLLDSIDKVCLLNSPIYYYRQRNNSIMHNKVSDKEAELFYTTELVTSKIEERYPELEVETRRMDSINDLKLLQRILNTDKNKFIEIQKSIIQKNRRNATVLLLSRKVSTLDKIKIVSLLLGKRVFYSVYAMGTKGKL